MLYPQVIKKSLFCALLITTHVAGIREQGIFENFIPGAIKSEEAGPDYKYIQNNFKKVDFIGKYANI